MTGDYYSYYAANDYLAHHGVLGMKWGQHIFGKVRSASSARQQKKEAKAKAKADKRSEADAKARRAKKISVESNRREAEERVKFYGGRNVAARELTNEYNKKTSKTIAKSALAATGGGLMGAMGLAAGQGGALIATGGLAAVPVAVAVGAYKVNKLHERYAEQKAYTMDVGTINRNAYGLTDFSRRK